jgi:hypothetical protein
MIYLASDMDNSGGCFEHGSKLVGSITCGKFIGYLRNSYFLQKEADPWSWLDIED